MESESKWSDKDWKWLVGILIGIMILMVASFFNSDKVEMNFSIISSAVSIALALVAIFIALKQDSDNQRVTNKMTEALMKIETKVNSMDGKIDNLDPNVITEPVKAKLIKELQDIINEPDEGKVENGQKIEEIVKSVNENFNEINNDLQYYSYRDGTRTYKYKVLISVPNDQEAIRKFLSEFNSTFKEMSFFTCSDNMLKINYFGKKLIRIETLEQMLKGYNNFHLIDVGFDGGTRDT
ncbi:hypothetical protein BFRIG_01866 [Peribacillus frigoritolerans]|uniref:hypothetical protein n=1 Tax=Peribacillus frigoritolerans TaxID=450367 RepID=UPI0030D0C93D